MIAAALCAYAWFVVVLAWPVICFIFLERKNDT
jgi:hypothetical protein